MEAIIHGLIFEVVVKMVVQKAQAAFKFLSWPVISQVFLFVVNSIAKAIHEELSKTVSFTLISLETEKQKKEYSQAVEKLKAVAEKPEASEAEIEKAKKEFMDAFDSLIRFGVLH
jgi:hypothetical protein